MIVIPLPEPKFDGSSNPYVAALSEWKDWCKGRGLTYMPAGSTRMSLERGQWCVKSYNPHGADLGSRWLEGRHICFHDEDVAHAMLFKLTWV